MGDVLLLRPTVWALRRARCQVTLLAPASAANLLRGDEDGQVQQVWPFESATVAPLWNDGAEASDGPCRELRRFEAAIVFSRNVSLAARIATLVPRLVRRDPEPPSTQHAAAWLAVAAQDLGCLPATEPLPKLPTCPPDAVVEAFLATLPEGFLALHPGSGSPAKNWPAERFAQLADAMAPERPFLLLEGPADAEAAAAVKGQTPRGVVARGLPVATAAALLARAGLYVGNDSGITHLAAAVGAPVLGLFGPTDPLVWAPLGPHVITLRAPGGDLARLSAAAVADYIWGAWTSKRLIRR